ncbi:hypothetical protein BG004_000394 [Podila humilis]|nr:hypothetical protein BG004_000394 [Podila humilis]
MASAEMTLQDWPTKDLMNSQHHPHNQDNVHPLDMDNSDSPKRSSLLPALPVGPGKHHTGLVVDTDVHNTDSAVEALGINASSPSSDASSISSPSSRMQSPPIPAGQAQSTFAIDPLQSTPTTLCSPPRETLFSPSENAQHPVPAPVSGPVPKAGPKSRGATTPSLLQTQVVDPRTTRSNSSTSTFTLASSNYSCESPISTLSPNVPHQPWMSNGVPSPKHGPLLTAGNSPSMGPYNVSRMAHSNSLPLPGPGSRKGSVVSLNSPRVSPGFRGAPLGQTSDTESVLKQFDVYFGKVYLRGQLQKKSDLGTDGHKLHGQQWAAYHAELIGPKLRITPMAGAGGLGGVAEEMNMEEATVEMQDGPNGGTFTVNWMGANRAVFQPVQQLSLGSPEVGQNCQDWVCAIRLSCYECSRLQEIYTSTLLRRPKFRDQVAATIEGSVKAEGLFKVKFWAGDQWQKLWVVVSDQRGEEVKKKKQGKILQAGPIRGQIHFYENQKSKKPFISMYNVSQAYAVCPSRSSINASKDNKVDEEGSLTIKLEGDVVMQRENLSPSRKGFFSSPTPPSMAAQDLQELLPMGRSHFAMFQVPNAVERTKFLLGTSEAFRIYGKPGPLLFDSPTDPAAMNFGCMASSLLQQELLIGLDAVLHLPQKGESLADVKFSYGEVLRKRLVAENPPTPSSYGGMGSTASCGSRQSVMMPYGIGPLHEDPKMMGMIPPSPMMNMAAMRSRANSGSGFLVPQPSPSLHPSYMAPWMGGSPHSPQLSAYSGSPRQGPVHASPYNQHLHRQNYAASNTSTDEYDANLVTDEEGEDDEYPDTPEDEDDAQVPFRSRSASLMAPSANGPSQGIASRKSSVGGLSVQGSRSVRSGSFTSGYGVQGGSTMMTPQEKKLELPTLTNSFSDDFVGIKNQDRSKEKQKKLTAVVYPTQVVIPKNKKMRENSLHSATTPVSATSLHSPHQLLPGAGAGAGTGGGCASPTIHVNEHAVIVVVLIVVILVIHPQNVLLVDRFSSTSSPVLKRAHPTQQWPFRILIFTSTSDSLFPTRGEAVLRTWMDYANNKHPELNIRVVMALEENSQYKRRASKSFPHMFVPKTSYEDLYIKIFHALASVYEQYPTFDYYMKADDDIFINIDRLAKYFRDSAHLLDPHKKNEWFGYNYNYMCWGGPGYIFSRKALQDMHPYLRTTCVDKYQQAEDLAVTACAMDYNGENWPGCTRIPGTDGSQFLHLYPLNPASWEGYDNVTWPAEDREMWASWDTDTKRLFHLRLQRPDQANYSWDKLITAHPIKQEQNPEPDMDQLYARSGMARI